MDGLKFQISSVKLDASVSARMMVLLKGLMAVWVEKRVGLRESAGGRGRRSQKSEIGRQRWHVRETYHDSENPPILHRKECFVPREYPLYGKFDRLTRHEERQGLLDDASDIGTRNGWCERLRKLGFQLRGHRLVKIKNESR